MGFKSLRSGWLIATLAILFCTAAISQTDPRMILDWDLIPASAGVAAKYRIQTTVGTLPYVTALECVVPPCTVTGINDAITYQIRVAGVEADGQEGEYSDSITFLFADIQSLSPTSLNQSNATSTTPGKIAKKLSWTAVTKFRTGRLIPAGSVIEYRIYQAGTSEVVAIATTQAISYTVQGLQKHKSFQVYVTCIVNGIESYASTAVRIIT